MGFWGGGYVWGLRGRLTKLRYLLSFEVVFSFFFEMVKSLNLEEDDFLVDLLIFFKKGS